MGVMHAKAPLDNPVEGMADFEVGVAPARVDRVHIDGVARTKNDVLAKAVQDLMDCTDFQQVLLRCSDVRRQLEILDSFKKIAVNIDTSKGPGASPNGYEVTFKVLERNRLIGGVNTLIGNNEGSMIIGAKLPNVAGRGEVIQTEYQYGTKHSSGFSLIASRPFLGRHNLRVTAAVYQQAADYPWNTFRECNRGLVAGVDLESMPGIHHSLQWQGVWRELNPLGITVPFPIREQMGHTLKSALKHTVTIDTRDNTILPASGYFFRLCQEFAGGHLGGDISFIKHEAEHQANYSLFNDAVFQLASNAGHMTTEGNYNICDKFFLGGPLGLRGFHLRGVGPHAETSSLGGTTYWASGVHLYTPLPLRRGHGFIGEYLRLHGFVTAGAICTGFKAERLKDPRVSAGLGLVLSMGHMARIELNYVVPLKHQPQDRTSGGLQVGIGMSFL
ncbi:sorting and assembly machinery component 50-like [Tropilaelaps mercedesae]|uniref:Sorting and assembly machinery component 50-like n=1 Tax=Tropilaelaps mercedesae TaxID=418985 RepID=A0A1V9XLP2_9ACAR|nr:sorting and assembly machinery component 50-like [Tropilaelaps mercedesae]